MHEKDEKSDHNDDEKGRKEFEESFEETKESTPKNANSIQKSKSHENLHGKEIPKKMEETAKEKAIGKSAEVQYFFFSKKQKN